MATRTRKLTASDFDDRIDILTRNAVAVPPAQDVHRKVCAILALVRVSALVLSTFTRGLLPMVQLGQGDWTQRFRGTIRMLFQHVRDSEDRNPRKGRG